MYGFEQVSKSKTRTERVIEAKWCKKEGKGVTLENVDFKKRRVDVLCAATERATYSTRNSGGWSP